MEKEGRVQIGEVTISTDEYLSLKTKELQEKHKADLAVKQEKLDRLNETLEKVIKDKGYLEYSSFHMRWGDSPRNEPKYISCDNVAKEFNDKISELNKALDDKSKEIETLKDDLLSRNTQVLRALNEDKKLKGTYKLLELLAAKDYMQFSTFPSSISVIVKQYLVEKGSSKCNVNTDFKGNIRSIEYLPAKQEDREYNYEPINYPDFIQWIIKNIPSIQLTENNVKDVVEEIKEEQPIIVGGKKLKGLRNFLVKGNKK